VRKAIRSGATEFRYERGQQPLPKMGPWKEELAQLLAANERKPARDRPTLMRVFEELRAPCPLRPGCCPSMLARITRLENVVCVTFGKHFAEKLRMLNKAFAANHRTTVSMRRSSTDSGAAVDGPRLTVMKEDKRVPAISYSGCASGTLFCSSHRCG
jgi:hypothetical protein